MLFETAAKSFSQTVTDERLKRSRRLMREAPERLIADIAASCGFESLATYYRVFNAAYGMAINGCAFFYGAITAWPPVTSGSTAGPRAQSSASRRFDALGRSAGWAENLSRARDLGKNLRFFRTFPRPLH